MGLDVTTNFLLAWPQNSYSLEMARGVKSFNTQSMLFSAGTGCELTVLAS